jgi:hypothetical protein
MRRLIAILGIIVLASAGCKHIGGKCDCGPNPGEATMYAPYPTMQSGPTAGASQPEVIGAPKATMKN